MKEFETSFTSIKWLHTSTSFTIFFILFFCETRAQVLQPLRFEFPLTQYEKHFEIIPANENGLYLQRSIILNKENQLQLVRLDTAFNQIWQGFIPLEKNYILMGKKSFGNELYLLLRYRDYTKNDFILLLVDQDNGRYRRLMIKGFIPFAPTEIVVTAQAVLIGGYYNRIPVVLHFSMITFKSKVLPGLFNDAGELTQIKTHEDGTFDVLISALNYLKQRTITIKNYDEEGNLIRNVPLESEPEKHLIFGRSLKTTSDVQIVAGVYGNRTAEFSRGIFIASIDLSGLQQIRYYNFADLENFFKHMKAKREKRVKSRIERRKIKGKRIRFNYRFLVHELVPYQDQYILLGEAFYPKYINMDRGYYNGFFTRYNTSTGTIIQNGRIFDGYYYTHAVVMGFKPNGDLVWDNSFEINDVRTFTLDQFVKLEIQKDKIALLYLFENKLRTKIIQNNEVLEGKTMDAIKTNSEFEIVKKDDSDINKLEYWYGDYLFAYGIQDIESVRPGENRKRVFYINKVKHAN